MKTKELKVEGKYLHIGFNTNTGEYSIFAKREGRAYQSPLSLSSLKGGF